MIIMTKQTRYKLKIGKFGHYFYDSMIQLNMSLESVLNRLNFLDKELDKWKKTSLNKSIEIIKLKRSE